MKISNELIGNFLVVGGISALIYLYIGYYKPKQEIAEQLKSGTLKK
jgi:hypothetical protein